MRYVKTLALTSIKMDKLDESLKEGLRKNMRFEVLANRTLDMRSEITKMNEKSGKQFHAERWN